MGYSRSGVPHDLLSTDRSFLTVPILSGVPILDQDINLMQSIQVDALASLKSELFISGISPKVFITGVSPMIAGFSDFDVRINGLTIQVRGNEAAANQITLNAPPTLAPRTDLVYLEIWLEDVDETGSLYQFGNVNHVSGGFTNDIVDPVIGQAATHRLQLRYRVSVSDGSTTLASPSIFIQGKAPSPLATTWGSQTADSNGIRYSTVTGASDYKDLSYAIPLFSIVRGINEASLDLTTVINLAPQSTMSPSLITSRSLLYFYGQL